MTGAERLDFKDLRDEMRGGFHDVTAAIGILASRVSSLESTRDHNEGAEEQREKDRQSAEQARDRGRGRFVWKVGLIVSLASPLSVFIVNVALRLVGIHL